MVHPLLGMVGVAYWLQPDILRELTTHGLLPPSMWWMFGILVFPALLSKSKRRFLINSAARMHSASFDRVPMESRSTHDTY